MIYGGPILQRGPQNVFLTFVYISSWCSLALCLRSHILLHYQTSSEFACRCLAWRDFSYLLTKNEISF